MNRLGLAVVLLVLLAATAVVSAHVTPPVILVSDRDALVGLLAGAKRFFVREVRLSPGERQSIEKQTGWNPDESFYRFYIGRDDQSRVVAAAVFVTEVTIHGPVRAAVALGPDGKVKGARVVELTEETYVWVKPLIDRDFTGAFVGRDARGAFAVNVAGDSMTHFYAEVVGSLIQRAAILYEEAVLKRGDAA